MAEVTINNDVTMRDEGARCQGGRLRPGDEILGRYVVEGNLGQGGMGVVYRCLDKVGGVEVAVKCLPPEVSHNAREMEDVRANYSLVARLHHSAICDVKTLERDADGLYFLVMELAVGEDLEQWMRKHADAPFEGKLAVLRQIAAALDYAHARKIIHRDVKPENVMIDANGHVSVLDFGLAAQIRSSLSRTSAAVISKSGTPTYKSPEQWRGRPQGPASDQYSLGVIAYRLLAGTLPFDGDDLVILGQAVLNEPLTPVSDVSKQINAALAKALAKKPEDRFATCTQFVDALEGKVRTATQRPSFKWLVCAAFVIAVSGGTWWFVSSRAEAEKVRQAEVPRQQQLADEKAAVDEVRRKAQEEVDRKAREETARQAQALRQAKEAAEKEAQAAKARQQELERQLAAERNNSVQSPAAENPDGADDEAMRDTIAETRRLGRRLANDRAQARRIVEGFAKYRCEDALADRLAAVDAAKKKIDDLPEPADATPGSNAVAVARAELEKLRYAVGWFAALDDLRGTLTQRQRNGKDILGQLETYRKDPEGFADRLAEADALGTRLAGLAVADATSGTNTLTEAQRCVDDLGKVRDWLERNASGRDAARQAANEIAQEIEPRLKKLETQKYAPTLYKEGLAGRDAARKLLDVGKFAEAALAYRAAREKLLKAEKDARDFLVKDGLETAQDHFDHSRWAEAKSAAEQVQKLDGGNEQAKKLVAEAETHLRPYLTLTATVDGYEVPGAKVTLGGKEFTLPQRLEFTKGSQHDAFEVTYETGGRRYAERFQGFTVDWLGEKVWKCSLKEQREPQKCKTKTITLPGGAELELVWCPAGKDLKGNDVKGFWMGKTEVTQKQWKSVMGTGLSNLTVSDEEDSSLPFETVLCDDKVMTRYYFGRSSTKKKLARSLVERERVERQRVASNKSRFDGDGRPVENVSWNDCKKFCRKAGHGLRLPTEQEWEYACLAGGTGDWGKRKNGEVGSLDVMGWYCDNSGRESHVVAWKEPNAWGIYDMHGNVWEWCEDTDGSNCVNRGGGWDSLPKHCTVGNRLCYYPDYRSDNVGFRLALSQD